MQIEADPPALEALSRRFRTFAETECRDSSPLYEHLSRGIAADEEMLRVALHCLPGQPAPNLFLAAVHFLLLQEETDPLAAFYPDLFGATMPPEMAYGPFRAFCLSRRTEIIDLISNGQPIPSRSERTAIGDHR
jgi:Uncharacterized protein conserved in bacteria (DUF2332)